MSDSPFKLTLYMELLTDSKPFSHFKTIVKMSEWCVDNLMYFSLMLSVNTTTFKVTISEETKTKDMASDPCPGCSQYAN